MRGETPPRLRLHVVHHLKLMLAFNVLPIVAGMWLTWQWHTGKMSLRVLSQEAKSSLIVVLATLVILAFNSWFFMPFARWLRDYAIWHLRRGPAWAWIIPTCGGWLAWSTSMVAQAVAIVVGFMEIWRLVPTNA